MVDQGNNDKEIKQDKNKNIDSTCSVKLPGLIAPPGSVLGHKEVET